MEIFFFGFDNHEQIPTDTHEIVFVNCCVYSVFTTLTAINFLKHSTFSHIQVGIQ
jgi:hypothetical protein